MAASDVRGGDFGRAGGEVRGLLSRAGVRLYLLLLAALALAGWIFPLTDHLGYELAELIAFAAGTFGATLGMAAARRTREADLRTAARSLGAAMFLALAALLLPIALSLLDGIRRPVCDPLAGLSIFAVLAAPSALLSCGAGFLAARIAPRRAGLLILIAFLASLAVTLWPIWSGPQVFAFNHLGGMYPGPIYDEAFGITSALVWFRAATLLYALACGMLGLVFTPRPLGGSRSSSGPRLAAFFFFLISIIPAVAISRKALALNFASSVEQLDQALGGRLETPHLVLHFPREKPEIERKLLARDAEASVAEVLDFLDAKNSSPARIDVFLYRSAEEKRRLIGAADTSFTKPWLRQIHTNDAPAPHPILRHELAHALAADYARGPFKVPASKDGILPDMAFIEGLAVAADWPAQESTVDEEAAALKKLDKLPDLQTLFLPGRFYGEAGPSAYTAVGSFIRFIWRTQGGAKLREAYGAKNGFASLGDLKNLVSEYQASLSRVVVPANVLALAALRFSQPAIVRKRCAHEVAELERLASQASSQGDDSRALSLWSSCVALEPDDPNLLLQERRAMLSSGQNEKAKELEQQIFAHPKLSQPQRAQLLIELGDSAFRSGDSASAAKSYAEASALAQTEAGTRALEARQYSLQDPARWPVGKRLFANNDAGPETWLLLRDLDLARPREGFAAYLLAKQAQNAHAWESCQRFATSALARELPSPLFTAEALRMRGLCDWRTGDDADARRAFLQLTQDPIEAHRLEAERLLRRTP